MDYIWNIYIYIYMEYVVIVAIDVLFPLVG